MLAAICILPALGFVLLALCGQALPRRVAGLIGCTTVAASGLILFSLLPDLWQGDITQDLGTWIGGAGSLSPHFRFLLDPLSATMGGIVCFIAFLIHVYSTEYMGHDDRHNLFFAYLNLFVSAMLILLLANDMLLLFLGWEGVGLCSYLLIGFWYEQKENGRCAQKAFLVTRIGDIAFMIALFVLFASFQTWGLAELESLISANWTVGSSLANTVALLFLIAAVAKSAQLPLHVWLPDAMAGPTPVSALLHSSTMVTAGVYLIARLHPLFLLSPDVMAVVAVVGALTALYAGMSALGQHDIKRLLAYSTISQIGYMFLALGVGAFGAGIFHFFTHAFFKALLFLGAGAVIHAVGGEQDMRRLGGLRRHLPLTFWTFLAGSAALAALPLLTSGFYSKDAILWAVFADGQHMLWIMGVITALLTGAYSTRMVLLTFFGKPYQGTLHKPGMAIALPLLLLGGLSVIAGFIETPATLGGIHAFTQWISGTFIGEAPAHGSHAAELMTQGIAGAAALLGIFIAYWFVLRKRDWSEKFLQQEPAAQLQSSLTEGLYIDAAYQRTWIRGFQQLSLWLRPEWIDRLINLALSVVRSANRVLSASQSGRVRWYALGLVIGAIIFMAGVLRIL